MIMIELEALNWSFQLLLYIYNMISGMSRADVKTSFSSCILHRRSDVLELFSSFIDLGKSRILDAICVPPSFWA